MAYPTLTVNPEFPLGEIPEKAGIVSKSDHGYVHGRRRYTMGRRTFRLVYNTMPTADKEDIDNHFDSVDIAESFSWTHPVTSTVYTVRYVEPPEMEYVKPGYWQVRIQLLSV